MKNKYINFMGLDFNVVTEKKKSFKGFRSNMNIEGDDLTEVYFYFCVIIDYLIDKNGCVSYPTYFSFCSSLNSYLNSLMFPGDCSSVETLTGFNPGKLIWHTVGCGNDAVGLRSEHIFELCIITLYQREWAGDLQLRAEGGRFFPA